MISWFHPPGSERAGRLCRVQRGHEQGDKQPEEQAEVGRKLSNLQLYLPPPKFPCLGKFDHCDIRELEDCENIAFLMANADSTKAARYTSAECQTCYTSAECQTCYMSGECRTCYMSVTDLLHKCRVRVCFWSVESGCACCLHCRD